MLLHAHTPTELRSKKIYLYAKQFAIYTHTHCILKIKKKERLKQIICEKSKAIYLFYKDICVYEYSSIYRDGEHMLFKLNIRY